MSKPKSQMVSPETAVILEGINQCLQATDETGRVVSNAKYGIYAFYDYDGEPIYVGQTTEKLRTRIRRHLTNQRTDAVAMNVLDPLEVAEIEMWPFWGLEKQKKTSDEVTETLNAAEFTVFQLALERSEFSAVLNEKRPPTTEPIELPASLRMRIVPDQLYELRKHPDVRIARRASTIANLARVISEREVSVGLRQTLITQARRLERLARERFMEFGKEYPVPEDE